MHETLFHPKTTLMKTRPLAVSLLFAALLTISVLILVFGSALMPVGAGSLSGISANLGDWPMYGQNPSRTSYNAAERTISRENASLLTTRWQAFVGSNGGTPSFSAPSVANGKVYVGSSVTTGNNLFAFDAPTGTPVWSTSVGHNPTSCFGVGVGSTASISGTILSIGGGDSAYYGLDAITGEQIWRHAVDAGPSGFAWVSPLLAHDRSYIGISAECDNPSVRGEVRALNLASGLIEATRELVPLGQAGGGIWNSPSLSPDGNTIAITTGEDYGGYDGPLTRAMVTLDARSLAVTGKNRQGVTDVDHDWVTSPAIFGSYNRLGPLVGATHKIGNFYAYLLSSVSEGPVWQRGTGVNTGMLPAYDPTYGQGGTLFVLGAAGTLYTLDPVTGADRRPPQIVGNASGNMAIANGLVFFNVEGSLVVLDEASGMLLRRITPPNAGSTYTGPAVANGFVYWNSGSYLNAASLPTGGEPSPTPTACTPHTFGDVPPGSTFYPYVSCLSTYGIVSGYGDCLFRPNNEVTRGQLSKIVSLAVGWEIQATEQLYEDVPSPNPFYPWINTLSRRGVVSGYPCGTRMDEPCVLPANRPYFRPGQSATRGQIAKIVAESAGLQRSLSGQRFEDVPPGHTFYPWIESLALRGIMGGYPCGGEGEPCGGQSSRPYFRPQNGATRGQTAKIVAGAFFTECNVIYQVASTEYLSK